MTDRLMERAKLLQGELHSLGDKVLFHERNRGKGAAVRTGIAAATGDYVVVQDADLEYDPADYAKLLEPLMHRGADVVFGSRFIGSQAHRVVYFWHMVGNRVLTLVSNMCTNLNLTDMEAGYKMFRREIFQRIKSGRRSIRIRSGDHGENSEAQVRDLRSRHFLPRPHLRGRQEDRLARRLPRSLRHLKYNLFRA